MVARLRVVLVMQTSIGATRYFMATPSIQNWGRVTSETLPLEYMARHNCHQPKGMTITRVVV